MSVRFSLSPRASSPRKRGPRTSSFLTLLVKYVLSKIAKKRLHSYGMRCLSWVPSSEGMTLGGKGIMHCFHLAVLAIGLTACTSEPYKDAELKTESSEERRASNMGKFLGEDALTFGGPKKREQEDTGLGVNSYLWRASLDTISFMPIASADPFGGVILTDWYSPPQSPQERLKVNIFILDRQLRSDGVKVSIFRQEWDSSGQWRDQAVDPKTVKDLEHAILAQARHFRTKATK